jgi:hypothetical protein
MQCQSERERERAKLVYLVVAFSLLQCCQSAKRGKGERDFVFFFLRFRVDSPKSVRIHAKKFTSARIHLTKMCANLLAELVEPRDLVCAGFTARLTAPSPPVWSKQKSRVSFTYKKWKCQKLDKNNNVIFYIYFVHPRKLFQKYFLAYTLRGLARANACNMSTPAVKCLD